MLHRFRFAAVLILVALALGAARAEMAVAGPSAAVNEAARSLIFRGTSADGVGDYDKAIGLFSEALKLKPDQSQTSSALTGRASAYQHAKRYGAAIEDMTAAIAQWPPDECYGRRMISHIVMLRAEIRAEAGDNAAALADYDRAFAELDAMRAMTCSGLDLEDVPSGYSEIYESRSKVHAAMHETQKAIDDMTSAINHGDASVMALLARGDLLAESGRCGEAVADFTRAAAINPMYGFTFLRRALCYETMERYDLAVADYSRLIWLNIEDPYNYYARAFAYRKLKDFAKADADLTKAIELSPGHASYYSGRCLVRMEAGRAGEALEDCNRAIALDPKDQHGYVNRGKLFRNKGQLKEAISDFSTAITLAPENADTLVLRARVLRANQQTDAALGDLAKAVTIDTGNAWAFQTRCEIYADLGRAEEAIADCTKSITLDGSSYGAYFTRAAALMEAGRYAAAVADLNVYLSTAPNFARAWFTRARAHLATGARAEARADLDRFLQLEPDAAYGWLWQDIAAPRAEFGSHARAGLGRTGGTDWPRPLLELYAGAKMPADVFAAAGDPDPHRRREQGCEADFYVGAWLLLKQDKAAEAAPLFARAVADCPPNFIEREGAAFMKTWPGPPD